MAEVLTSKPPYKGRVTAKEVKAYLRSLISGYKIPRYVKVVPHYPLTASGKVQKYLLREAR